MNYFLIKLTVHCSTVQIRYLSSVRCVEILHGGISSRCSSARAQLFLSIYVGTRARKYHPNIICFSVTKCDRPVSLSTVEISARTQNTNIFFFMSWLRNVAKPQRQQCYIYLLTDSGGYVIWCALGRWARVFTRKSRVHRRLKTPINKYIGQVECCKHRRQQSVLCCRWRNSRSHHKIRMMTWLAGGKWNDVFLVAIFFASRRDVKKHHGVVI